MSQWSVNLGESIFLSTSSDPHEQERDLDGDGLKDDLESKLADYFRPYYKFDKDEGARRESEPITLFQVSPINKYYSGLTPPKEVPKQIWIRWVFLFKKDGGYGPDSWCRDAHNGDNDSATYRLISTDDGITWELEHVILGAYTRPRSGMYLSLPNCKLEEAPGYPHHPVIFMSAHKHHMYFDNSYNHKDSFYSKHGCNDDVAGDGDGFLSDLSSISKITGSPLLNNVGEPTRLLEKLYANPLPHIDFGINPITSPITATVRITKKTATYQRENPAGKKKEISRSAGKWQRSSGGWILDSVL